MHHQLERLLEHTGYFIAVILVLGITAFNLGFILGLIIA
jgi:hypothetical protein